MPGCGGICVGTTNVGAPNWLMMAGVVCVLLLLLLLLPLVLLPGFPLNTCAVNGGGGPCGAGPNDG